MIQIYVDNDGNKVGIVEEGDHIEFIDIVDFDFGFNFLGSFVFSDFSDFLCWRSFGEVLTFVIQEKGR